MKLGPRLRQEALCSRSAFAVARGAFLAINGIQTTEHPADQLLGLTTAFKFMAEACGYTPGQLLHITDLMEDDCRYRDVNTLDAVRMYVDREVAQQLPR
jgi:hypothetical protein